jgi:hypothetical protein
MRFAERRPAPPFGAPALARQPDGQTHEGTQTAASE